MMPITVKSDDVRSGRKAKGRHGPLGRLGSQWANELKIKDLPSRRKCFPRLKILKIKKISRGNVLKSEYSEK